MSLAGRLFMDVSYTRTQHGNVGITRTVRRLLDELETIAGCKPVVFHRTGFRLLRPAHRSPTASGVTAIDNAAGRMFRWLNSAPVRKLVSLLPEAVLRKAWRLNNDLTFDSLSKDEEPLTFRGGDCLVLADQSWNYRVWLATQQAQAQGANVVLVLYDLIPIRHPEFCPPLFTDVFRLWLVRMLGCCDMVMCISAATEADLLTWCTEENLPLPRTRHFRLGCDLPKENAGDIRESIARFMRSSVPVFAAVGTIEPRKNYSMLLRTFERLWLEGVNAHLLIAGRTTGEETDLVERLRMHPEQGRRLLTLFDASDQELAHVYGHARALVFPSLAEGFGLPLVEARAHDCQVIASDIPAFRELEEPGISYFSVGAADQLSRLIVHHADKCNSPPHRTSKPAWSWAQSSTELLQKIEDLLGQPF
jgi:glycosyltransferase involved in cell wall biosynthesis